MGRTNKVIDATTDQVEQAKQTAIALVNDTASASSIDDLFFSNDLTKIENGIKKLNDFSNKSWILSSILLLTLIYDNNAYKQSGLTWSEYAKHTRERLGLEPRDVSEQLSSARFYIKYHDAMERYGWTPTSASRKLARAELALQLTGDIDAVLTHLANDTWIEFKNWYQSYKGAKELEYKNERKRDDIAIKKNKVYIKDVEAVTISNKIPKQDKERLQKYMLQIFDALQQGYEPAIVPVYDEKEAQILPKLRDKHRQGK